MVGMKNSLHALKAKPSNEQLESWAVLIHESMSRSSRNYHSIQHVFDIAQDETDPILVLSAFFHDCIYYHVDGGFSKYQASILKDVVDIEELGEHHLTISTDDTLLNMVECIFGFQPGQAVGPNSGLNEFLSAIVAVRKLEPVLSKDHLAQIACCIEATIPFRSTNDKTPSTMDMLHERMIKANCEFELGMSDDILVEAVKRAVRTSHLDLANFATTDRAFFLDNAWSLLPETNESLRKNQYLYTVQEFQKAVYNLYGFFSFLEPTVIFMSFRGFPEPQELAVMTTEATRNINVGRRYVKAKLLSMSVLTAFAVLTGGDAPMALLIGDLFSRQDDSRRLQDVLPTPPPERVENGCDIDVYNILLKGRHQETSFDIRQSPVAAYLYGWMADDTVDKLLKDRQVCPMDADNAKDLLAHMPRNLVQRVGTVLAEVAVSRSDAICAVIQDLPETSCSQDLSGA
jgi:hypothetical protein